MHAQQPTACLNCDTEFTANFCPECGQSATTARLEVRNLLRELAVDTLHLDTGFLRTFMALLRDPGGACRDYVEGQRRWLSSPIRYCLTVLAITVLAFTLTGYDPGSELTDLEKAGQETSKIFVDYATRYPSLAFFVPLPLIALTHRWLFRKSGRNYLEILVFNFFVAAQFNLLFLPIQLFAPLPIEYVSLITFLLLLPYAVWAARPFFGDPIWKISLKFLILGAVLFFGIIAGTVAYMFATGDVPPGVAS